MRFRLRDYYPLWCLYSTALRLTHNFVTSAESRHDPEHIVLQPPAGNACPLAPARFGLIPFRSPLLGESRLISFPRGTEMFQFPRLSSPQPMCSARDNAALPALGLPIRESTGQRPFNTSPWLIAVVHALHRLLVPRHPPCALTILTVINSRCDEPSDSIMVIPNYLFGQLCSFQGPCKSAARVMPGWSLKTQQHVCGPEGPRFVQARSTC